MTKKRLQVLWDDRKFRVVVMSDWTVAQVKECIVTSHNSVYPNLHVSPEMIASLRDSDGCDLENNCIVADLVVQDNVLWSVIPLPARASEVSALPLSLPLSLDAPTTHVPVSHISTKDDLIATFGKDVTSRLLAAEDWQGTVNVLAASAGTDVAGDFPPSAEQALAFVSTDRPPEPSSDDDSVAMDVSKPNKAKHTRNNPTAMSTANDRDKTVDVSSLPSSIKPSKRARADDHPPAAPTNTSSNHPVSEPAPVKQGKRARLDSTTSVTSNSSGRGDHSSQSPVAPVRNNGQTNLLQSQPLHALRQAYEANIQELIAKHPNMKANGLVTALIKLRKESKNDKSQLLALVTTMLEEARAPKPTKTTMTKPQLEQHSANDSDSDDEASSDADSESEEDEPPARAQQSSTSARFARLSNSSETNGEEDFKTPQPASRANRSAIAAPKVSALPLHKGATEPMSLSMPKLPSQQHHAHKAQVALPSSSSSKTANDDKKLATTKISTQFQVRPEPSDSESEHDDDEHTVTARLNAGHFPVYRSDVLLELQKNHVAPASKTSAVSGLVVPPSPSLYVGDSVLSELSHHKLSAMQVSRTKPRSSQLSDDEDDEDSPAVESLQSGSSDSESSSDDEAAGSRKLKLALPSSDKKKPIRKPAAKSTPKSRDMLQVTVPTPAANASPVHSLAASPAPVLNPKTLARRQQRLNPTVLSYNGSDAQQQVEKAGGIDEFISKPWPNHK